MLWVSRFKMIPIWLVAAITIIFAAPDLFAASFLAKQADEVTVDFDQKGESSYILLGLDVNDLIENALETTRDEIRTDLRSARIGYTGLTVSGRTAQVSITELSQVDAAMTALKRLTDPVAADGSVQEMTLDASEPGLLKFAVTDAGIKYWMQTALAQSVEVIKRRIRELGGSESGIAEPIVRQQGDDRIIVQEPGLKDRQRLNKMLSLPAKLTVQMIDQSMPVQDAINGRPPSRSSVLYSQDNPPVPYLVKDRIIVSDENLINAKATYSSQSNEPVVLFRLDSDGTARLGRATSQNIDGLLAVVLDNQVVSVTAIREPVLDGIGQISGNFTVQSANDLVSLLRAGPLPVRLTIAEESPMAAPK
jgi:SecD/SecF fusion protein